MFFNKKIYFLYILLLFHNLTTPAAKALVQKLSGTKPAVSAVKQIHLPGYFTCQKDMSWAKKIGITSPDYAPLRNEHQFSILKLPKDFPIKGTYQALVKNRVQHEAWQNKFNDFVEQKYGIRKQQTSPMDYLAYEKEHGPVSQYDDRSIRLIEEAARQKTEARIRRINKNPKEFVNNVKLVQQRPELQYDFKQRLKSSMPISEFERDEFSGQLAYDGTKKKPSAIELIKEQNELDRKNVEWFERYLAWLKEKRKQNPDYWTSKDFNQEIEMEQAYAATNNDPQPPVSPPNQRASIYERMSAYKKEQQKSLK